MSITFITRTRRSPPALLCTVYLTCQAASQVGSSNEVLVASHHIISFFINSVIAIIPIASHPIYQPLCRSRHRRHHLGNPSSRRARGALNDRCREAVFPSPCLPPRKREFGTIHRLLRVAGPPCHHPLVMRILQCKSSSFAMHRHGSPSELRFMLYLDRSISKI